MTNDKKDAPVGGATEVKQYKMLSGIENGEMVFTDQPKGFPRYSGLRDAVTLQVSVFPRQGSKGPFLSRDLQIAIPTPDGRRSRQAVYGCQPTFALMRPRAGGGFEAIPLNEVQDLLISIIPQGGFLSVNQPITDNLVSVIGGITKTAGVAYSTGRSSDIDVSELEV